MMLLAKEVELDIFLCVLVVCVRVTANGCEPIRSHSGCKLFFEGISKPLRLPALTPIKISAQAQNQPESGVYPPPSTDPAEPGQAIW